MATGDRQLGNTAFPGGKGRIGLFRAAGSAAQSGRMMAGFGTGAARYNRVARLLHWVMAALVIGNILGGLLHETVKDIVNLVPLHKSIGLTVLALTIARIAWRLTWQHPPYPPAMEPWQIAAAKAVQAVFYTLMLAMPLSGWVMASAGKYPLGWFGLFDVPKFAVAKESALYLASRQGHEVLGWLFAGLVVIHIAAALRHHLILKDRVLERML
jgi:cytochrome b561